MDSTLTTLAAIGLGLALAAGMVAHTRNDDRVRGELAGCRADLAIEGEVADACMSVVEQCRALVEGHACSCWRVSE